MRRHSYSARRVAAIGLCWAFALLGSAAPVHAHQMTLIGRDALQSGNFLVGYATLFDSGRYEEEFSALDPTVIHEVVDSGSVDGQALGLPVRGEASFLTRQIYAFPDNMLIVGGEATTAVATPHGHVSVGANALSRLELTFVLQEPIDFTFAGTLVEGVGATVNGLEGRADAWIELSGPSGTWRFSDAGGFVERGVLDAGTWRIDARADSRGNASAEFSAIVLLLPAPVPEPATWALLLAGLGVVLARRRGQPSLDRSAAGQPML